MATFVVLDSWGAGGGGGGGGDVTGPGSSTDNAVVRWSGVAGTDVLNSGVIIDNSNNVTGVVALTATGAVTGTRLVVTGSTVAVNGVYLPAANTVGISANSALIASVSSTGLAVTGDVSSTAVVSGARLVVTGSTVATNGVYLPAANTVGISANSALIASVSGTGLAVTGDVSATVALSGARLVVTGSTVATNGVYLPAANTVGISANSALIASISATGLAVTGDVSATTIVSGASFVVTGSTVATNGIYLPAANTVGISANSALIASVSGTGLAVTGLISATTVVSGASVVVTGSTVATNGMYLPTANNVGISANSVQGILVSSGGVGIHGAIASDTVLNVGATNPLTTATQIAMRSSIVGTSAATSGIRGVNISAGTAAASFTCAAVLSVNCGTISLGAGSTITRAVSYFSSTQTNGSTGNATLADNLTFSGNFFINSSTANPSLFSGVVNMSAGLRTKISSANVTNPPTDAELDSAFGTPATVGAGFIGLVDDNGANTNEYIVWTDGTTWFYATGTLAA